jgi:hypothetical protein
MKLDRQDWHKLRSPLLALVIIAALAIGLVGIAQNYNRQQAGALDRQQRLLLAAQQRYQASGSEQAIIVASLPQYQRLIDKGFVGEERRIEWVDALREQHQRHQLFAIKYNIGQQEDYKPIFAPDLGGFLLRRSVMSLDLDLLHEGDILHLIDSLASTSKAPFMLRDCVINRLGAVAALSQQLATNLHAQCEIDWLTLHEPTPRI